ncbi:MAG: hypothetical protein FD128_1931, partial [Hyphomonadaceae bacterium]
MPDSTEPTGNIAKMLEIMANE